MFGPCPEPDEIAAQLALPAADPRRAHVDGCPRCQAFAASFREFLQPSSAPATADRQDADQRLRATLLPEGGPPLLPTESAGVAGGAGRARTAESSRPAPRPSRRRPRGGTVPVRWRWAAAGAVAAAVVALALFRPSPPRMGSTVLREQPSSSGATAATVPVLDPPRSLDGQGIRLSWAPIAQADAYEVVLYSVALVEVTRVGPLTQAELLLTRDRLPTTIAAGTPLLVRVVALRQGAPLGTSRAASLLTPP